MGRKYPPAEPVDTYGPSIMICNFPLRPRHFKPLPKVNIRKAIGIVQWTVSWAAAVPQLLYPEPTAIKWHFSQENATLLDAGKGM
jgi:hypothetical protein